MTNIVYLQWFIVWVPCTLVHCICTYMCVMCSIFMSVVYVGHMLVHVLEEDIECPSLLHSN